jgi:hypothetical protein
MEAGVGHMATVAGDAVPSANERAVRVEGSVQPYDLIPRGNPFGSLESPQVAVVE